MEMTDEEVKQALDEIATDIRGQIEELREQQKRQADEIQEKMDEITKSILGDRPLEPLHTPQRWPSDNLEKQVEWIKSEFAQMVKEMEEEKESMERFEKELDQECEEIMEDMARRGEKLNQEIQEVRDLHRQVEAELNEKLRKFREDMRAINRPLEELLSQLRKLRDSDKKLNEESFDRYLETERVIEAMEEAIETETYELKVKKSYKSGLVPKWTHPSLSKVSYTVTPVYRTINEFDEKLNNNEEIVIDPFYTTNGGYQMTLGLYCDGDGSDVSVFIHLLKGDNDDVLPFPFTGNIIVQALNWSEDSRHIEKIISFDESTPQDSRRRATYEKVDSGRGWGVLSFLSRLDLESQYVHNDRLCLRVLFEEIHLIGSPVPSWYNTVINSSVPVPPCTVTLHRYSLWKKTNSVWASKPFYSSERGYKLQLEVFANGVGSGRGTHVSIGVYLMKGEYDEELQWPLNATITVQLLNWSCDSDHIEKTIYHCEGPIEYRSRVIKRNTAQGAMGYCYFISHSVLNYDDKSNIRYIYQDKLCFKIISIDLIFV